jgi:hypothetical protein
MNKPKFQRVNPLGDADTDEPIDALLRRPSKAKRNRKWEAENKSRAYRGIEDKTHERLVTLADELRVPVGDLVNHLLTKSLDMVESGRLNLDTRPVIGKNKLV